MSNAIEQTAQDILEDTLDLKYEHVFDLRKAWTYFWTLVFLYIPFHFIATPNLSLSERIVVVVCFNLFVRQILGDPIRKQLTEESYQRLTAYLRNEDTSVTN